MDIPELIGALFGVTGIWLTVKEKVWCFPVGLVNVTITAWLVFNQKLYADLLQQVMYFVLLIIGWVNWSKTISVSRIKISFLTGSELFQIFSVFIAGASILYFLLHNYTDASVPFWDATGTMICFIAQYLIARKKIENWLLWMVANVMYIFIFWYKDMGYYSALSFIYLIQAVAGWNSWKKKSETKTPHVVVSSHQVL